MRIAALVLLAVAVAYSQDHAKCSVVRVEVTDEAVHRARELHKKQEPVAQIRIEQPYKLVVSGVAITPWEIVTPALHPRADLRVLVTLHDGRTHLASVVGTDPLSNLALIRVAQPMKYYLALHEAQVEKKQAVVVVGHTFKGCVAVAGSVARPYTQLSMTDLYRVNRGRNVPLGSAFVVSHRPTRPQPGSGCLDARGRLIGVVAGGMPIMGAAEMTFVLPSARVARIVRDLRTKGHVVRAHFGVGIVPVNDYLRAQFPKLPACAAAVTSVQRTGPAARAGLKRHDVIVAVDGKRYRDCGQLGEALSDKTPGAAVALLVMRAGKLLTFTATPSQRK